MMKCKIISWAVGACCLVAAAGAYFVGSAIASSESMISKGAGDTQADLSMEEIIAILHEKGLGEVYEVEREWGSYEVKIRDPQGLKLKLHVDSRTGAVLNQKRDHDDDDEGDDD